MRRTAERTSSLSVSVRLEESDLDGNVGTEAQLASVPDKFLSSDSKRPLRYIDDDGSVYTYSLRPLFYSVIFILLIELLERFSFYGVTNTQLEYLVGHYNPEWNAGLTSVQASSFVGASSALAYTAPFIGGIMADGLFGDYLNIILGTSFLYLPGLILIALCSYPYLLGNEFNTAALRAGMLVLWPLGAGFIKSVVNVYGAKQFHPVLQREMIESYYISFYMVINVGALLGGTILPVVAVNSIAAAYTIPSVALFVGLVVFVLGSKRYVNAKPRKDALYKTLKALTSPLTCKSLNSQKQTNGGPLKDSFVDGIKNLLYVFPCTCLILPFCIAYNQMTTVFMIQANAMKTVIDPSLMQNFDSLSVLVNGLIYQRYVHPFFSRISLKTTHKFAIGTFCGLLALLTALIIDYQIHSKYNGDGQPTVNILWQIPAFFFVGAGEILTIALAYDVTFVIAPKEQKGLASGINLFVFGALSNFICIGIYNSCKAWFPSDATSMEQYTSSQVYKYLWVMIGISGFGILFNLLPPVANWQEGVINRSINLNKSIEAESKDDLTESLLLNA